MNKRRAHRPELSDLTPKNPDTESCCIYCGNTRNVPASRYAGMCLSCYLDFHEDDIMLDCFNVEAMPA
jgi:hypothetical protein